METIFQINKQFILKLKDIFTINVSIRIVEAFLSKFYLEEPLAKELKKI
jgi:hypothetical protein